MNITNVRIRINNKNDSKVKGVAAITIDDCFVVHDIKVLQGQDELFIAMPSKKTPDGDFKDIAHPINSEARKMICDSIIAEYKKALAEQPAVAPQATEEVKEENKQ